MLPTHCYPLWSFLTITHYDPCSLLPIRIPTHSLLLLIMIPTHYSPLWSQLTKYYPSWSQLIITHHDPYSYYPSWSVLIIATEMIVKDSSLRRRKCVLNNLSKYFTELVFYKSFIIIWLLSVNFEKFFSITLSSDQLQLFKHSTVICPSVTLSRSIYQS